MFCCNSNINKLARLTTDELYKLHAWFAANRLSLNVLKTNHMIFRNCSVKINNEEINGVEVTTLLDDLIDAKLTWKNLFLL